MKRGRICAISVDVDEAEDEDLRHGRSAGDGEAVEHKGVGDKEGSLGRRSKAKDPEAAAHKLCRQRAEAEKQNDAL